MTTAAEIWQTLSKIDVSNKVENKNGLNYLSWAWAWGTLMEYYPQATYDFVDDTNLEDGSMIVRCVVKIEDIERFMWLAVMDYKNQPIKNPSSTHIANTRMRCLTKCLAMFGLGHFVYAGEDLPESVKQENQHKKEMFNDLLKAVDEEDHWGVAKFNMQVSKDQWKNVVSRYENTADKAKINSLKSKGVKLFEGVKREYLAYRQADDDLGMKQSIDELPDDYFKAKLIELAQ